MIHITIDGLSGSGKSTICKRLSTKLGIFYADPNMIVNAISLKCVKSGINPTSEKDVAGLLLKTKVTFMYVPSGTKVKLDGEDVTGMLGHRIVSQSFYAVSSLKCVKSYIAKLQEKVLKTTSAIIEGLDVGDVDITKIKHKFFLTCDVNKRVKRKFDALRAKEIFDITYEQLLEDTIESDNNAYVGEMSKIKLTQDINIIDTTDKSIDSIVDEIIKIIGV